MSDANDLDLIDAAIAPRSRETERPSLIIVRQPHRAGARPTSTTRRRPTAKPLGEEEIRPTKEAYGWPEDAHVPGSPGSEADTCAKPWIAAQKWESEWNQKLRRLSQANRRWPTSCDMMQKDELPRRLGQGHPFFPADAERQSDARDQRRGGECRRKNVPWLVGGSADLAPSTKTLIKDARRFRERQLQRAELPLRHPRARDGRDRERHVALEAASRSARRS